MKNLHVFIDAAVVTTLTLLMSLLLVSVLSDVLSLESSEQKGYEMEDIYSRIAAKRTVRKLNPDIVVVSIDKCSRVDIANLIDGIALCEPKCIGLDVFFEYPTGDDQNLISAISECENIVLPVTIEYEPSGSNFILGKESYFYPLLDSLHTGVVNFPADDGRVIRKIRPFFGNMDSFSAALCRMASPEKYQKLLKRGNEFETINFTASEFQEYDAFEIIDSEGYLRENTVELLRDRIVLIGETDGFMDRHTTPADPIMPGIVVHAKALDTMLYGGYVKKSGRFLNILLAMVCCFLFSFLNLKAKYSKNWGNLGALGIRGLQLSLIYLFLLIGSSAFVCGGIYFDFSIAVVMMCNTAIFADIWMGIKELIKKLPKFAKSIICKFKK